MDFLTEIFNKNFDTYFIVLIILGNNIILSNLPDKVLNFHKSKTYLTVVNSILMGVGYYYLDQYFETEPTNMKILINSFLLSTSLYEMGLKELINFIKDNGKNFLIKKTAEKMEIEAPVEKQENEKNI